MEQKKDWIDLVNVVSCIAVVYLHANGCFWTFSTDRYWFTANIIECVFYFAVPCFFMITGATLMDHNDRYDLTTYFNKRINKTVVPYVAWSCIGIAYALLVGSLKIEEINAVYLWDAFINAKAVSYYWFFPALFGVYITLPVIAAVQKEKRKEIFTMASIAGVLLIGFMPMLSNLLHVNWNGQLNLQLGGYLLLTIIGWLISEIEIVPKGRITIYTIAIMGLLAHIVGTYLMSIRAGEIIQTFKGYTNAPCIAYSVGVFTWLRYNGHRILRMEAVKKAVDIINPNTLGIYLMQFFILNMMQRLLDINTLSMSYRLGAPVLVISISILAIMFIRTIPLLKRIVP